MLLCCLVYNGLKNELEWYVVVVRVGCNDIWRYYFVLDKFYLLIIKFCYNKMCFFIDKNKIFYYYLRYVDINLFNKIKNV